MAITKELFISILIASLFGLGLFNFATGFYSDTNVNLEDNGTLTELNLAMNESITDISVIGSNMRDTLEGGEGFDIVTNIIFGIPKAFMNVITLPFSLITTLTTLISIMLSALIYIPPIYLNVAITAFSLVIVFALISLMFRKDF